MISYDRYIQPPLNSYINTKSYVSTIQDPYKSLTVDNVIYFYNSKDEVIPNAMIDSNCNYEKGFIDTFLAFSDKYLYSESVDAGYFLDIGANIGTTCIYIQKNLKHSLKSIAFEAVKENAILLKINAIINNLEDRVIVENLGVSDTKKVMAVNINEKNMGGGGLSFDEVSTAENVIETIPIDDYLKNNSISHDSIKYIWIDTEGHEYYVLKGAVNLIKGNKIPVFLEFNQCLYKSQGFYDEMIMLLEKLFSRFILAIDVYNGKLDMRKIEEITCLWEELNCESIDIILF